MLQRNVALQGGKPKESYKNMEIMTLKREVGMFSNQVSVISVMSKLE